MMKSLRTHIIDILERENRACKKTMLKNKKALKDPKTEEFQVNAKIKMDIYDPPRSYYGKGITLKEAFDNIHDSYEEDNGIKVCEMFSQDLFYDVHVTLKGGAKVEVPHQYWKKYEWKREAK